MMKFVLPLFMVAATSAQTYFYPTTTSSMYRYGGYSSYYPTYMPSTYPTTYIRSGYYYPYTRTHMTMTYPTFMARSEGAYDTAAVKDTKAATVHHVPKPVDAPVMTTGHHVPMTVGHVPTTPVAAHHHHHPGHMAVAVPATFAYGYQPVSVAQAIAPAPKSDVVPTIPADTTAAHGHHMAHHVPAPVAYVPAPAGYVPAPVSFAYAPSHITGAQHDTAPVGMTGGASFVPAGAVPVDVKGTFEPATVSGAHHDTKHTNFEGKKSTF